MLKSQFSFDKDFVVNIACGLNLLNLSVYGGALIRSGKWFFLMYEGSTKIELGKPSIKEPFYDLNQVNLQRRNHYMSCCRDQGKKNANSEIPWSFLSYISSCMFLGSCSDRVLFFSLVYLHERHWTLYMESQFIWLNKTLLWPFVDVQVHSPFVDDINGFCNKPYGGSTVWVDWGLL